MAVAGPGHLVRIWIDSFLVHAIVISCRPPCWRGMVNLVPMPAVATGCHSYGCFLIHASGGGCA